MKAALTDGIAKLEAKLKAKKKEAAKILKAEKVREKIELSKKINRKKLLIGEAFLAAVESGKFPKSDFDKIIDDFVKNDEDKKLFV